MQVFVGTSGFAIEEWKGHFYPADLPSDRRLDYYSSRLGSVEVNNTFYQMPKAALLETWRDTVPDGFRFALKAPRRITHIQRLRPTGESLDLFVAAASALDDKLGPILFQLPPFARKDGPLLADFLARLPDTLRVAFEFRHSSWFDDEIYGILAQRNAALCGGDAEKDDRSPPFVTTADFGYLRLRAASYDERSLRTWSDRILGGSWKNAYVYLKHEVLGPDYAVFLAAIASGSIDASLPIGTTAAVADGSVGSEPDGTRAKKRTKGTPPTSKARTSTPSGRRSPKSARSNQ